MNNGWVKLHKKTVENKIWRHHPTAWRVFEALLLLADKNGQWTGGRKQIAKVANINESSVYRGLRLLEAEQQISVNANNRYSIIHICNWSKYQAVANNKITNNRTTTEQQPNTLIRIENKTINTNTDVLVFGKPEINKIFEYWAETTGIPITSQIKANRYAASSLLKQHGEDKLKRLIDGVSVAQSDRFAPRIGSFTQLRAKLPELLVWGKQQQSRKEII